MHVLAIKEPSEKAAGVGLRSPQNGIHTLPPPLSEKLNTVADRPIINTF